MPTISREQLGDLLATWLEKSSSPANAKQVAKDIGYNDSPFFGAGKKKARLMGELVMANTALAILAVNQVFDVGDARVIIDAFLSIARKSIFTILEARDSTFKERYERRLSEYFKTFSEERALLGMSFAFMENLDLDPIQNGQGQILVTSRFSSSLAETTDVLKSLRDGSRPTQSSSPRSRSQVVGTRSRSSEFLGLVAEFITYGAEQGLSVPAEHGLAGSAAGGLIAGFSRFAEIDDLQAFLVSVMTEDPNCKMMREECLSIMGDIGRRETVAEIEEEEEPLALLVELIVEHPSMAKLRNLFRVMPQQAAELGAATGVLVALTICRAKPALARHIIDSAAW